MSRGRGRGRGDSWRTRPLNQNPTPRKHHLYDDRDADLEIQTTDNVLFRGHSYYLKAARQVEHFGSILIHQHVLPMYASTSRRTLIRRQQQDYSHRCAITHLLHALDLVEGNAPGVKMRYYCLSVIEQVLELGDRYGFNTLPRLLLPVMHRFAHALPWKVFAFAAKNDFEFLAVYALERLDSDVNFNRTGIANFDHSLLAGFPTHYMVPLVRNITLFRKDDGTADWKRVAQNFPDLREGAEELQIHHERRVDVGWHAPHMVDDGWGDPLMVDDGWGN